MNIDGWKKEFGEFDGQVGWAEVEIKGFLKIVGFFSVEDVCGVKMLLAHPLDSTGNDFARHSYYPPWSIHSITPASVDTCEHLSRGDALYTCEEPVDFDENKNAKRYCGKQYWRARNTPYWTCRYCDEHQPKGSNDEEIF